MIRLDTGHLDMPEGQLPTDRLRPDGVVVHSLTAHALAAMDRHKWIESQHAGRDLGDSAVRDWLDRYWKGWTRAKLIEHIYGWRCWGAFGEDDFGCLAKRSVEFHVPPEVLEQVAGILANGGENLNVLAWAIDQGLPLESIEWLLDRIDINAKRQRLLTDHIRLFIERK